MCSGLRNVAHADVRLTPNRSYEYFYDDAQLTASILSVADVPKSAVA